MKKVIWQIILTVCCISLFLSCHLDVRRTTTDHNSVSDIKTMSSTAHDRKADSRFLYEDLAVDSSTQSIYTVNVESLSESILYSRPYGSNIVTFDINGTGSKLISKPDGWRFLQPLKSNIVYSTDSSLIIADEDSNIVKSIAYPQDLIALLQKNLDSLSSVSEDFRLLVADQGEESTVWANGLMLYDLNDGNKKRILPEGYYCFNAKFIDSNNVFVETQSKIPNVNRDYMTYSIQTGTTHTIGNNEDIGFYLGLSLSSLLFEKGYYDVNTNIFTPVNLPNYTMSTDGHIYYIENGQLLEFDTETGSSYPFYGTALCSFANSKWTHTNTKNQLVLHGFGADNFDRGYYCITVSTTENTVPD